MTNLKELKNKVEHCLNIYPESRNCDVKLTNAVWVNFYQNKLKKIDGEWLLPLLNKYHVPSQDSIARCRRLFQEKGLYMPTDPNVIKKRRLRTQEVFELLSDKQVNDIFS